MQSIGLVLIGVGIGALGNSLDWSGVWTLVSGMLTRARTVAGGGLAKAGAGGAILLLGLALTFGGGLQLGGCPGPGPGPGPDPPGPVDPNPPIPIPTPTPSPIKAKGYRVLITYDQANKAGIPDSQSDLLNSSVLRQWLDQHCVKDPRSIPENRIVPHTAKFGAEEPIWQEMQALPKASPQWLVVSNGDDGVSMALPMTEAELMPILEKFVK